MDTGHIRGNPTIIFFPSFFSILFLRFLYPELTHVNYCPILFYISIRFINVALEKDCIHLKFVGRDTFQGMEGGVSPHDEYECELDMMCSDWAIGGCPDGCDGYEKKTE